MLVTTLTDAVAYPAITAVVKRMYKTDDPARLAESKDRYRHLKRIARKQWLPYHVEAGTDSRYPWSSTVTRTERVMSAAGTM